MSDQIQYVLDPKAIVTLVLKEKGIHEGLWSLSVEFQLSVGLAGPTPATALPSAMTAVSKIGIQKGNEINGVTFDAAELNPAPKARQSKKASAA